MTTRVPVYMVLIASVVAIALTVEVAIMSYSDAFTRTWWSATIGFGVCLISLLFCIRTWTGWRA